MTSAENTDTEKLKSYIEFLHLKIFHGFINFFPAFKEYRNVRATVRVCSSFFLFSKTLGNNDLFQLRRKTETHREKKAHTYQERLTFCRTSPVFDYEIFKKKIVLASFRKRLNKMANRQIWTRYLGSVTAVPPNK